MLTNPPKQQLRQSLLEREAKNLYLLDDFWQYRCKREAITAKNNFPEEGCVAVTYYYEVTVNIAHPTGILPTMLYPFKYKKTYHLCPDCWIYPQDDPATRHMKRQLFEDFAKQDCRHFYVADIEGKFRDVYAEEYTKLVNQ